MNYAEMLEALVATDLEAHREEFPQEIGRIRTEHETRGSALSGEEDFDLTGVAAEEFRKRSLIILQNCKSSLEGLGKGLDIQTAKQFEETAIELLTAEASEIVSMVERIFPSKGVFLWGSVGRLDLRRSIKDRIEGLLTAESRRISAEVGLLKDQRRFL